MFYSRVNIDSWSWLGLLISLPEYTSCGCYRNYCCVYWGMDWISIGFHFRQVCIQIKHRSFGIEIQNYKGSRSSHPRRRTQIRDFAPIMPPRALQCFQLHYGRNGRKLWRVCDWGCWHVAWHHSLRVCRHNCGLTN